MLLESSHLWPSIWDFATLAMSRRVKKHCEQPDQIPGRALLRCRCPRWRCWLQSLAHKEKEAPPGSASLTPPCWESLLTSPSVQNSSSVCTCTCTDFISQCMSCMEQGSPGTMPAFLYVDAAYYMGRLPRCERCLADQPSRSSKRAVSCFAPSEARHKLLLLRRLVKQRGRQWSSFQPKYPETVSVSRLACLFEQMPALRKVCTVCVLEVVVSAGCDALHPAFCMSSVCQQIAQRVWDRVKQETPTSFWM